MTPHLLVVTDEKSGDAAVADMRGELRPLVRCLLHQMGLQVAEPQIELSEGTGERHK
ncbi:MAG: hypothetical protein AB7Y46_09365 [Armatimonadota bacterium]